MLPEDDEEQIVLHPPLSWAKTLQENNRLHRLIVWQCKGIYKGFFGRKVIYKIFYITFENVLSCLPYDSLVLIKYSSQKMSALRRQLSQQSILLLKKLTKYLGKKQTTRQRASHDIFQITRTSVFLIVVAKIQEVKQSFIFLLSFQPNLEIAC